MASRLQPTKLVIQAGESTSGPTDLTQLRVRALHVGALPKGGVTLRFSARPREIGEGRVPIDFAPIGGNLGLGMHLDVAGHYPTPDWLGAVIHLRAAAQDSSGTPLNWDEDLIVWLIGEVAR